MKISIIIRTLNEAYYMPELLESISNQKVNGAVETVVIDSGSTDNTVEIAQKYNARLTFIEKSDFSFGRSLNQACAFADGDIFVFVSGHCIPRDKHWLSHLVAPMVSTTVGYVYGRQLGRDTTKFSERQIFKKYFPPHENPNNADFFCNNANAAIKREIWQQYLFDEEVTGLEDMELARRYVLDGGCVAYAPQSTVFHIHNETWSQTRKRYEREALALQKIMPELHLSLGEALRFFLVAVLHDGSQALEEKRFFSEFLSIVTFRLAQYWGSYKGSKPMRKLSMKQKLNYFYPRN